MKALKNILAPCLVLISLAISAACSEKETAADPGDEADLVPDQPPDETPDPVPDSAPDVPPEVMPDDSPDDSPEATPDGPEDIAPDITPDGTSCTYNHADLSLTDQQCYYQDGNYVLNGSFEESAVTPPDSTFVLELWPHQGGPSSAGSYTFEDVNYNECGLCCVVSLGCTSATCQRYFLVTSGTIDITELGAVGDQLTATLTDARAIEVTIDWADMASTPVPGGQTFCIDSASLSATVELFGG